MLPAPSSLHVTNLTDLIWLRKECRASAERAGRLFDLSPEVAIFYRELSDGALESLCGELDLALLVPRFDSKTLPLALAKAGRGHRERHSGDLELHNLGNFQALREACKRCNGDAVWAYRINQETADAYRTIDHGEVVALCKSLSVSAFLPRYGAVEMTRILDKPVGARAMFAAAYEVDVAAASEAARRSIFLTH